MQIELVGEDVPGEGVLIAFVDAQLAMSAAAEELDRRSDGGLTAVLGSLPGKRKHGEIVDLLAPRGLDLQRLLVVVLGEEGRQSAVEIEELGGKIAQRLLNARIAHAVIAAPTGLDLKLEVDAFFRALLTGLRLRAYRFTKYRATDGEDERPEITSLDLALADDGAHRTMLQRVDACVQGVARARDLVSEPANTLFPKQFVEECRALQELGVELEVLGPDRLAELEMNALLGVAQGSAREPYLVVMRWRGGEQPDRAPLALVGKGVCFDTGGISLKPAAGMEEMKSDMAGAAAVVGAMTAIAARRAPAHVVGIVALVENMPSSNAQRPGDVVRAMSGKTIEVINTDAEGRLVLADALHYTVEHVKPEVMIDLATLTGAIIVALGRERAGLFSNDDELAAALGRAGTEVGERLWRMPIGKAYSKHIRSDIAEIKNVGRQREAGATAGAVFLQEFVGDTKWAHLDIAGTAWSSRDLPLARKGATGFGVRLLDAYCESAFEA